MEIFFFFFLSTPSPTAPERVTCSLLTSIAGSFLVMNIPWVGCFCLFAFFSFFGNCQVAAPGHSVSGVRTVDESFTYRIPVWWVLVEAGCFSLNLFDHAICLG